jgi:hypothetical protein
MLLRLLAAIAALIVISGIVLEFWAHPPLGYISRGRL